MRLLGLDVGSTTIKGVVIAEAEGRPLRSYYERHRGDLAGAARRAIEELLGRDDDSHTVRPLVTGIAAHWLAERWAAPHVHEVSATAEAVRRRHPTARTIVELGGQDAKLILLDPESTRAAQAAMNDRCAAGTGVTIDRCLGRLGLDARAAAAVPYAAARVRRVSTKCGVFAETDLVNLARRGVATDDLVVSLADAIVVQNLAVLVRGQTPEPPVVLLGGPHVHLPALEGAWRHRLGELWRERGIGARAHLGPEAVRVPPDALLYAAIGACELGRLRHPDGPAATAAWLIERVREPAGGASDIRLDAPFERAAEPASAPAAPPFVPTAGHRRSIEVAVGIDAGSTSCKAVAIDPSGALVASVACPSREPVADAQGLLDALARRIDLRLDVRSIGVTGYGGPVLGPVLGADAEIVETIAHARAARAATGDVEVVCDVGGQDIKILRLSPSGEIRDFWLSSQCSAGIGALLESVAKDLGVSAAEFGTRAFGAKRVPWFADSCVVFLDSSRIAYQRLGFDTAEILAGLARALPRIVWSYVTNGSAPASLGRSFLLQGGVHRNAAVLRAQVDYLRAEVAGARVAVHPHPAEAGAIGAALAGKDARSRRGRDDSRRLDGLAGARITARSDEATHCGLCPSRCPRTFVEVSAPGCAPSTYVTGNGCAEGADPDRVPAAARAEAARKKRAAPNLWAEETRLLFGRRPVRRLFSPARRLRIGVPRILCMFRAAPFFRTYLESLGAEVVFSPYTSESMWREGACHGANDPCFPVKVTLAHVHHLLYRVHDRGAPLDALFVPHFTHAVTAVRHVADSASCPVVTAAPLLVRSAFGAPGGDLERRRIELLAPVVTITRRDRVGDQMYEGFAQRFGMSRQDSDGAVGAGFEALEQVDARLVARGREVLDGVEAGRWPSAVLVLARPYHADRGLNHRLGDELRALGLPVLGIRSLPRDAATLGRLFGEDLRGGRIEDPYDIRDLLDGCANSGAAERVWAARFAARHGRLAVVDLSSFKCGQDSPTYGPIGELFESAKVVRCALYDLDETRPVTSLRVRLRTFAEALSERGLLA